MVFKSLINFMPKVVNDKFWRTSQICLEFPAQKKSLLLYKLSIRSIHRAMMHSSNSRAANFRFNKELHNNRIDAATIENDVERKEFMESLQRCDMQLDRNMLQTLAIYEPRTFKSLTQISKAKLSEDGLQHPLRTM